eukprot:6183690-Pleurochrysis_carterae.AAC.3
MSQRAWSRASSLTHPPSPRAARAEQVLRVRFGGADGTRRACVLCRGGGCIGTIPTPSSKGARGLTRMARAMPDRPRSPGRGWRGGRRWPPARHPDPISREGRESARPGAGGPDGLRSIVATLAWPWRHRQTGCNHYQYKKPLLLNSWEERVTFFGNTWPPSPKSDAVDAALEDGAEGASSTPSTSKRRKPERKGASVSEDSSETADNALDVLASAAEKSPPAPSVPTAPVVSKPATFVPTLSHAKNKRTKPRTQQLSDKSAHSPTNKPRAPLAPFAVQLF